MAAVIYTIGHSNHPIDVFINLLAKYDIETLVDIRSNPYSRYANQYNKELIQKAVEEIGIEYLYLGQSLGGRPDYASFYDEEGNIVYDKIRKSPEFQHGIERLLKKSNDYLTAIFCGEEDPTNCHRRFLIGKTLLQRGLKVCHIRGDGSLQEEKQLAPCSILKDRDKLLPLFDCWGH
jgi:uncharacterized protein (DUF488 family)